ncbi:NAD-dependent protein deacylase SIR4 [Erysiphe neolycopersici]|uniref:NAD-dependent protein deacylase SIR4 n=1 Tax=Erysiphe neolycopersici TaxID=212602 RepID=A0A420HQB7_9PEZI|nr:NAD-dependent protein deacylase SIR4 [Erysiphe neolycopersici]
MQKSLLKIPYLGPLAPPHIIPKDAGSLSGAVTALREFLITSPSSSLPDDVLDPASTVLLTGAGLSVASGLADYRGTAGTYKVNRNYRPIYYHEFLSSHEARKRYWARSFLGWKNLDRAKPNPAHFAIKDLGAMKIVRSVITQNVDSFHLTAHPDLPTLELHGYLRALKCLSCNREYSRQEFQVELEKLNPIWKAFLEDAYKSGAFQIKDPVERKSKGISTNPDGDVDVPGAPYSTFRYPACPNCSKNPPLENDGSRKRIEVDEDGAWKVGGTCGILKPSVVMFGESIASDVKEAAERAIDSSGRLLVLGTSLATYSAWRLAKRAKDRGMPIGIINLGGVRAEEVFFKDLLDSKNGKTAVRAELRTDEILPKLVESLKTPGSSTTVNEASNFKTENINQNMLS